jgi:hypothetical protein
VTGGYPQARLFSARVLHFDREPRTGLAAFAQVPESPRKIRPIVAALILGNFTCAYGDEP